MKIRVRWLLCCVAALAFYGHAAEEAGTEKKQTPPTPPAQPTQPEVATEQDKALAGEAEKLIPLSQNTAGKEAANFISGVPWMNSQLQVLKGEMKGNLKSARGNIGRFVDEMKKGQDWPVPEPIEIPKAKAAPTLDGRIDTDEWKDAVVLDKTYEMDTKNPSGQRTVWRLLWDKDYLYLSCDCDDTDIQAPHLERDTALYKYDCVEVFIHPDPKSMKFVELIVSPSGAIFDALHTKHADKWGEDPGGAAWTMEGLKTASIFKKEDGKPVGFSIEIAIPFKTLPGFDEAGATANRAVSLMLVRADKNGTDNEKYYSYTPLLSWSHNIWNYGKATLVDK